MIIIKARFKYGLVKMKECCFRSENNRYINEADLKDINYFVIDALNNRKRPQISWKVTHDNKGKSGVVTGISREFNVTSHQKWESRFNSLIEAVNMNVK